jgi:hypothetical protein
VYWDQPNADASDDLVITTVMSSWISAGTSTSKVPDATPLLSLSVCVILPNGATHWLPSAIFPVVSAGINASSRFALDGDEATIRYPLNDSTVALISTTCDSPAVIVKDSVGLIKAPSILTSRPKKLRVPSPTVRGRWGLPTDAFPTRHCPAPDGKQKDLRMIKKERADRKSRR